MAALNDNKEAGMNFSFNRWLVGLSRPVKRLVMLTADALMLPLMMYLAFAVRLGEWEPIGTDAAVLLLVLTPVLSLPLLYAAGFYRAVVRFIGSEMAWVILGCTSVTALMLGTLLFMGQAEGVPRSVIPIFWAFSLLWLGGSRFLVRRWLVWALQGQRGRIPVAIYGAGGCGVQLAAALGQVSVYEPKVFVDDDPRLRGTLIQGVRVVRRESLKKLLDRHGIETVLLAMPSVSRQRRLGVVQFLESLGVQVKSVPALPDVVAGRARIEDVHDVDIEDLLGREAVPPDMTLLRAPVAGRVVMVTGAGGSIGGELCRQILAQGPSRLVLFERSEFALYTIEQELRQWLAKLSMPVEVVPLLGSVACGSQVEHACHTYKVETLFHAAAYKHVPLVEMNPIAGIENNLLGTYCTALAAEAAGVERFVLISTDKAVRPTNVMGATKRFAEIILQALSERGSKTVFTMVRFGNVLGSSGSVVPLFRKQILNGGPVTLTHEDITRYFMTIPEAAQLVIQAGAMAQGGEVFLLDMGEPVKIIDMARSMIRLMGYSVRDEANPEGDIAIQITGLRPGEKLYEELLIGTDSTGTNHPMVMQAHEAHPSWAEVQTIVKEFEQAVQERDKGRLLGLLRRVVSGYHPELAGGKTAQVISLDERRLESV